MFIVSDPARSQKLRVAVFFFFCPLCTVSQTTLMLKMVCERDESVLRFE